MSKFALKFQQTNILFVIMQTPVDKYSSGVATIKTK